MVRLTTLTGALDRLDEQLSAGGPPAEELLAPIRAIVDAVADLDRPAPELPELPPSADDVSPPTVRLKANPMAAPQMLLPGLEPDEGRALREFFALEAHERLDEVETALAVLEREEGPETDVRPPADALLRAAHTLKGAAGTVGRAAVAEAVHLLEEYVARIRDGRTRPSPTLMEALHACADLIRSLVDEIDDNPAAQLRIEAMGRRLQAAVATSLSAPPSTGSTSTVADLEFRIDRRRGERSVIRVEVERVDALARYVGELVIDRTRVEKRALEVRGTARDLLSCKSAARQAMAALRKGSTVPSDVDEAFARLAELEVRLSDAANNLDHAAAGLTDDIASLRRTSSSLQSGLNRVRMTPLRWLMTRLGRPLRDLARRYGKHIDVLTEGEETELDKAVVEQMADPLLHLVRNTVAHGIETPEVRQRHDKPEQGTVRVSARQKGDHVFLVVADDGAGIDPETVRATLIRRGDLEPAAAAELTEAELVDAIFLPSFSTRDLADELAGRGIGLDAVRQAVTRLGGEVQVESRVGVGTTFTVRLPLTTAITQALLFKLGGEVYAIPMANVVETALGPIPATPAGAPTPPSTLTLRDGGEIALLHLDGLLGLVPPPSGLRPLGVVLVYGGNRFAIGVDKVIGPREIAVRRMGDLLSALSLYAGATISGSGKVQLIFDVATLAQLARQKEVRPADPTPVAPRDLSILLVDDSRTVRETLTRILRAAGYRVEEATDGGEAWERACDHAYDLIVTDLEMPRLHGLDLIARLARGIKGRTVPVIAMSSRVAAGSGARAAGAQDFLAKPVTRRAILESIRRALAATRS